MANTALESLFKNETGELHNVPLNVYRELPTENVTDEFAKEINDIFAEVYTLLDARDAVDHYMSLDRSKLSVEALEIEEKRLHTAVPQNILAAAGGEEKASEGFFTKIKNAISNFFTKTLSNFLKKIIGIDFDKQAYALQKELKDLAEFGGNKVTISGISNLTANNGKNMWSPQQMAGILAKFSNIDRHFEAIWKIASKPDGNAFEQDIASIAKTMFGFVGFNNKNYCLVGWNNGADKMLNSVSPVTANSVSWRVVDFNKNTSSFKADTKKEIDAILAGVVLFHMGIDKLRKNLDKKWISSLKNDEFDKEDARRIHNVMMFFHGILIYFQDFAQASLKWCKACMASK